LVAPPLDDVGAKGAANRAVGQARWQHKRISGRVEEMLNMWSGGAKES